MTDSLFAVASYDLGGNAGYVVEAVFTTREKAAEWCRESTAAWQQKWPNDSEPYWVEEGTIPLDPEPAE